MTRDSEISVNVRRLPCITRKGYFTGNSISLHDQRLVSGAKRAQHRAYLKVRLQFTHLLMPHVHDLLPSSPPIRYLHAVGRTSSDLDHGMKRRMFKGLNRLDNM